MGSRITGSQIVQNRKIQKKIGHCNTEKTKTGAFKSTKIDKASDKITEQNESWKIYAFMALMYSNLEIPRRYSGNSLQLTNWILDSGATCHMTPEISYFVPVSLVETNKFI